MIYSVVFINWEAIKSLLIFVGTFGRCVRTATSAHKQTRQRYCYDETKRAELKQNKCPADIADTEWGAKREWIGKLKGDFSIVEQLRVLSRKDE